MIDLPPFQYEFYEGGLVVVERTAAIIQDICKLMYTQAVPFGQHLLACSVRGFNSCAIFLPKVDLNTSQITHDLLLKHELGHCAGWPANHPIR